MAMPAREDIRRAVRLFKHTFGHRTPMRWDLLSELLWWVRADLKPSDYIEGPSNARQAARGVVTEAAYRDDPATLLAVARHIVETSAAAPVVAPVPEVADAPQSDAESDEPDDLSALVALGWTGDEASRMHPDSVALIREGQITGDNGRDLIREEDAALILVLPDPEPAPEPKPEPAEMSAHLKGLLKSHKIHDLAQLDGESITEMGILEWKGMGAGRLAELERLMKARGFALKP